jgi:uncharacterized protein (DUF433 family)
MSKRIRSTPPRARRGRSRRETSGHLVTTSLRLSASLRAYLEALAERSRRSLSDVAQLLLDEAIRVRECPGIYFADEPTGRTAKVMGTGLGVWEIMRDYLAGGAREEQLREIFPQLNPAQIAAARNYFLRFREEIQRRIDDDAALTAEVVAARYPGLVRIAG